LHSVSISTARAKAIRGIAANGLTHPLASRLLSGKPCLAGFDHTRGSSLAAFDPDNRGVEQGSRLNSKAGEKSSRSPPLWKANTADTLPMFFEKFRELGLRHAKT
jgi:hypothetical protein